MPSPSVRDWSYSEWSQLPVLRDRKSYLHHFGELRAHHFHQLVGRHKPKVVVLGGLSAAYLRYWQIIGSPFLVHREWPGGLQCRFGPREWKTQFVIVSNGGARGVSSAYYEGLGVLLHERLEVHGR